jgi:hypothetical protein
LRLLAFKSRVLGLVVTVVVVAGARGADPGLGPHDSSFAVSMESPPPEPAVFWQRFDSAFDNNVNDIFADTLQPLNSIKWNLQLRGPDFSDRFRARAASRARFAFTKSVEYGMREAAVEVPFMVWLDDHEGWLANLLRDSIDNVNEEAVAPLDISHEGAAYSWWRNLANGGTHYGIRPLRTSPYAYVSHEFTDGEKTILLARARYYYDRFADHRVELTFSVPVAYGMALDFGSAYEFGTHTERRLVVKVLKQFKGGGVAHLGFEVRDRPTVIAGITFGW